MDRVNAVPRGATAFRRAAALNVLTLALWKVNSLSNNDLARRYSHDIAEILSRGEPGMGYANHGAAPTLPIQKNLPNTHSQTLMQFSESKMRAGPS